jgi:hypothetical protein
MVFTTEEHDLLRRAFDNAVNEAGPAPDLEWLVAGRDRGRLGHVEPVRRRSVVALITLGVALLGGTAILVAQQRPGEVATSPPTMSTPTVPDGSQPWLASGEPISDEQFRAIFGDERSYGFPGYVPGSAIQLAWSPAYLGEFEIGLFALQQDLDEISDGQFPGRRYCMTSYAAPIGNTPNAHAGGATCAESVEEFELLISGFGFGGGGSCAGWLGNVAYLWGVPPDVASVEFRLRDATALIANVDDNGYALVAWDHDTPLVGVNYEGISPEHADYLDWFIADDPMSCSESSAAKPG